MSRIGKSIINVPQDVTVQAKENYVFVKGPHGELQEELESYFTLQNNNGELSIIPEGFDIKRAKTIPKKVKSLWGLRRALIQNMIYGVVNKFSKTLEVNGVGYRANINGNYLILNLGYSHPIAVVIPQDLEVKVDQNKIIVSGICKKTIGHFAAKVRALRIPDPYKAKGIKYIDETIVRKEGKKS